MISSWHLDFQIRSPAPVLFWRLRLVGFKAPLGMSPGTHGRERASIFRKSV